jgi:hypothetical protein
MDLEGGSAGCRSTSSWFSQAKADPSSSAMRSIVGYSLQRLDTQITNALIGRGQNAVLDARTAHGEAEYFEA